MFIFYSIINALVRIGCDRISCHAKALCSNLGKIQLIDGIAWHMVLGLLYFGILGG